MIDVINKVNCCGCEACYNVCPQRCIEMKSDDKGFLYPDVNQGSCVDCGLCKKVCPILNYAPRKENKQQEAYLLQHKDPVICKESTAGGAFTGIASYVIEQGGIVFGVEMTEDYIVRHTSVERIEDLKKFRNSKYVQSRVGKTFQQVKTELKKGRLVCFSGTPCQIEGLRTFLRKDYENLILVDVVCRAVPSPGVWKKYIQYEVNKKGKIDSVRFRDKTMGYQFSTMELHSYKGKTYRGGAESQPWLKLFFSGMIIRPSCTDCKFRGQYRNSDFTIWDCFNSKKYSAEIDNEKGVTRVLVHSEKAKRILERIKTSYIYIQMKPSDIVVEKSAMFLSPQQYSSTSGYYYDVKRLTPEKLKKKYFEYSSREKILYCFRILLKKMHLNGVIKQILLVLRGKN